MTATLGVVVYYALVPLVVSTIAYLVVRRSYGGDK